MKTRKRVQFISNKPSMTQQHLKKECDVNSIMERYRKTGLINHISRRQPVSGDFTSYSDFKTNMDMVLEAQDAFDALPAHVRKKFANDPSNLIDFISDDSNYEEALKLGLVDKKPEIPKAPQNDDKTTKKEPSTPPAT